MRGSTASSPLIPKSNRLFSKVRAPRVRTAPAPISNLCLKGEKLTLPLLLKIGYELDDLLLPYKIDLSTFHTLDNPELIEHIRRVGEVLYNKGRVRASVCPDFILSGAIRYRNLRL